MYAITPRFAPTSTDDQLDAAGALWREHPDCFMQTHLSENQGEIAWEGRNCFPSARVIWMCTTITTSADNAQSSGTASI